MKTLHEAMIECIDKEFYLTKVKKENGDFYYYETELYTDYRDELDHTHIKKILDSDNPMDEFNELISESYFESECYERDYMVDEVMKKIHEYYELDDLQENVELEDEVREWIEDYVNISLPYDKFLRQDIKLNLCTDFYNESNTDFTCNSFYLDGIPYQKKLPKGSITWLVNSQGYKMDELYNDYYGTKKSDSKFIQSVSEELDNSTYSMQLLTFFIRMELGDFIEWKTKKSDFVIQKNINCGLYNPWNGSCGMLEIKLEKDIKIPYKNIYSLDYDGSLGYGVDEICGLVDEFWQ